MASSVEIIIAEAGNCSDEELLEALSSVLLDRIEVLQDLVDWAAPDHVYGPARSLTERRYAGCVKSFSEKNGYGFISSPEIVEAFGRDLLVSDKQIHGFRAGDDVTFAILMNKGKPQAFDLTGSDPTGGFQRKGSAGGNDFSGKGFGKEYGGKHSGDWAARLPPAVPRGSWSVPAAEWVNAESARAPPPRATLASQKGKGKAQAVGPSTTSQVEIHGVTDARYNGRVKSFKPNKFGFLECEALQESTGGQDIYVHWDQLGGFTTGDLVSFAVIVNEKNGVKGVDLRGPEHGGHSRPAKRPRH